MCQDGILSPILFNVYVDELIELLHDSGYGCYVNITFIQVSTPPGKSWKLLENDLGSGMIWKFTCKVLECPGIF